MSHELRSDNLKKKNESGRSRPSGPTVCHLTQILYFSSPDWSFCPSHHYGEQSLQLLCSPALELSSTLPRKCRSTSFFPSSLKTHLFKTAFSLWLYLSFCFLFIHLFACLISTLTPLIWLVFKVMVILPLYGVVECQKGALKKMYHHHHHHIIVYYYYLYLHEQPSRS